MRAARWDCVSQVLPKVQKASKQALAHLKDHSERSLRPIQATQMTPDPFWTRKKNLKHFRLQIKIWILENYFSLKEPHNWLSLWNDCEQRFFPKSWNDIVARSPKHGVSSWWWHCWHGQFYGGLWPMLWPGLIVGPYADSFDLSSSTTISYNMDTILPGLG